MILRASQLWRVPPRIMYGRHVDDPEVSALLQTPWAEILISEGWIETTDTGTCGCAVWTMPGFPRSPQRVTAHEDPCRECPLDHLIVHTNKPPGAVGAAFRQFGRRLTKPQVVRYGRRHAYGAASVVHADAAKTESVAEQQFLSAYMVLRPRELAGLVTQYPILRYRVDFAIPQRKLAIEIDGYAFHSDHAAFTRDRDKDRELGSIGWLVTRFPGKRACDEPTRCVREAAQWAAAVRGGI